MPAVNWCLSAHQLQLMFDVTCHKLKHRKWKHQRHTRISINPFLAHFCQRRHFLKHKRKHISVEIAPFNRNNLLWTHTNTHTFFFFLPSNSFQRNRQFSWFILSNNFILHFIICLHLCLFAFFTFYFPGFYFALKILYTHTFIVIFIHLKASHMLCSFPPKITAKKSTFHVLSFSGFTQHSLDGIA